MQRQISQYQHMHHTTAVPTADLVNSIINWPFVSIKIIKIFVLLWQVRSPLHVLAKATTKRTDQHDYLTIFVSKTRFPKRQSELTMRG